MPNFGDLEATSRQLARHLQQMHELGLRDDTINLQALQVHYKPIILVSVHRNFLLKITY